MLKSMKCINNPSLLTGLNSVLMDGIVTQGYAYFQTNPLAVFVLPFKTLVTPIPYFATADKTEENSTMSPSALIPITGFLRAFLRAFMLFSLLTSLGSVGLVVLFLLRYSLQGWHSPCLDVPLHNAPQFLQ